MDIHPRLPANQQLIQMERWPVVGEQAPLKSERPWEITICGEVARPLTMSLQELRQIEAVRFTTDIHCVTRWSKLDMEFEGVTLARLLESVTPQPTARFVSFVARSERNHSSSLALREALELGAFATWSVGGLPLPEIHGGPVRVIVPGRYFYKSVKWLERVELLAEDRLGYWERDAGYHNHADPWREERYIAASISKQEAAQLMATRDFSGRDLRSIQAAERDLTGLAARKSLLRDADFRSAKLSGADFSGANLSNAHFDSADLRGACFLNADVEGASFVGSDLRGADLRVASMFGASFCAISEAGRVTDAALLDDTTKLPGDRMTALTDAQRAWLMERFPG